MAPIRIERLRYPPKSMPRYTNSSVTAGNTAITANATQNGDPEISSTMDSAAT